VLGVVIDGAGVVITVGLKGFIRVPIACTITKASIAETSNTPITGSIQVEVWSDLNANYPPTVSAKISGSAPVTLSSQNHNEDSVLSGWTTAIPAGNWVGFNVLATPALVKRVIIELQITPS
jgi:hypothetical protein